MFIYDIKLNFLDKYYLFYDWLQSDNIITIDKINIHKISNEELDDLLVYKIKLKDLAFIKKVNIHLFTDDFSFVAIKFNSQGESILKSALLPEDEIKITDLQLSLKRTTLNYDIISSPDAENNLRINDEVRNTILKEFQNDENIDKLKYLYYEWFHKKTGNFKLILNDMKRRLLLPLTKEEYKIYNLIKKHYKSV